MLFDKIMMRIQPYAAVMQSNSTLRQTQAVTGRMARYKKLN